MDELKNRLFGIMIDVFQVKKSQINMETKPESIKEWDSLKHVLLLMAIEEEFEFRFTDDEMIKCNDAKSIWDVISKKSRSRNE